MDLPRREIYIDLLGKYWDTAIFCRYANLEILRDRIRQLSSTITIVDSSTIINNLEKAIIYFKEEMARYKELKDDKEIANEHRTIC